MTLHNLHNEELKQERLLSGLEDKGLKMELTNKYEENVVVEMADESGIVYFAAEETGW